MSSYKSTYKSTSLDRRRRHLPYLPDDVFGLIMYERNRIMRREGAQKLWKRIIHYEEIMEELNGELLEWEEEMDGEEVEETEDKIKELAKSVINMHKQRAKLIDPMELDEFWLMSRVA